MLAFIGTKEGRVLIEKISSAGTSRLGETKNGIAYGAICGIDVSADQDKMVCTTETGEIIVIDILTNIEKTSKQKIE